MQDVVNARIQHISGQMVMERSTVNRQMSTLLMMFSTNIAKTFLMVKANNLETSIIL